MPHPLFVRASGRRLLLIGVTALLCALASTNESRTAAQAGAQTAAATMTATSAVTATATLTATLTSSATRTATGSPTATASTTPSDTATPSDTPTESNTPSPTFTPTHAGLPITLWYSWQGSDAHTLQTALDAYQAAHAEIALTTQSIDLNTLTFAQFADRLAAAKRAGQSPTALLLPASWIADLRDSSLIASLPSGSLVAIRQLVSAPAWNAVTDRGAIFGVPIGLTCAALFANPALTTADPLTAEALLKLPNVAVPFDFYDTAGVFFAQGGSLSQLTKLTATTRAEPPATLIAYLTAVHDWYAITSSATPIPYPTSIGNVLTAPTPAIPLPSDIGFRLGRQPYSIGDSALYTGYHLALPVKILPFPKFAAGGNWQPLVTVQAMALTTHDARLRTAALGLVDTLVGTQTQVKMGSDANYLPVNADAAATLSDPGLIELTAQCQAGVFPSPDEARFIRSPLLDNAVYAVTVGNQQPASAANQIVAQLVPTITPTITLTPSITPVGG